MYKNHFKVVWESGEDCAMSLEVYVADGNSAVAQKAKLPLDVQLLQKKQTMARHIHLDLLHPHKYKMST